MTDADRRHSLSPNGTTIPLAQPQSGSMPEKRDDTKFTDGDSPGLGESWDGRVGCFYAVDSHDVV